MSASKTTSQINAEDRRNKLIAVAAGVVMIGVFYYVWTDSGTPVAPAPAAVAAPVAASAPTVKLVTPPGNTAGVAAKTVGSTAAALDPTLHMQAMLVTESVAYTGSGRNIFAGAGQVQEMAPIPKPIGSARTGTVAPPTPPRQYVPPAAMGPPPIELKFFGMITSPDGQHRQAFLLHGDDVFLASKGEVVQRKYRVIDIGPNSIQVEDMSNNNRQTLPLQANQ